MKRRATSAPMDPWQIDEGEFPTQGTDQAKLRFLVRYAVLAPSSHNSQPWRFRIVGDELEMHIDRARGLPVADPEERELLLSCGAALFNLRLALRHFGYFGELRTLEPSPEFDPLGPRSVPECLAKVRLGESHVASAAEERLFEAIPRRCTNRRAFESSPLPANLIAELQAAALDEGAWVVHVDGVVQRARLAQLIARADREQWADSAFRRELADWLRPNRSPARDGMPGYAFDLSEVESLVSPLVVRNFDRGDGQAARDMELAEGSPALLVIGTDSDDPSAWLDAGQALARMLLLATTHEVSASFLNQPLEVPELRPLVLDICGMSGYGQLILRLGYGPATPHTPRRPAEEVTVVKDGRNPSSPAEAQT